MKGLCYIVLIIGFFLFFQQDPIMAVVVIVIFLGVFLFFKSRKSGSGRGLFGFLKGKQSPQDSRMDDLVTLMMIQQLMNSPTNGSSDKVEEEDQMSKNIYLEKTEKEVLELLDGD